MRWRSRGLIQDVRQLLLDLPERVVWVRRANELVARTAAGLLRAVRLPWRWWDGFRDDEPVAAGFTREEVLRKLEALLRQPGSRRYKPA
jgi:hypothetical protein